MDFAFKMVQGGLNDETVLTGIENEDYEERLHQRAYNKMAGGLINDQSMLSLENYRGTVEKKQLLEVVNKLLVKPTLDLNEQHALELSLFSIYNNINSTIRKIQTPNMVNIFPPSNHQGINPFTLDTLDKILSHVYDAEKMLFKPSSTNAVKREDETRRSTSCSK